MNLIQRTALQVCVLVSVALHAGVLLFGAGSPARPVERISAPPAAVLVAQAMAKLENPPEQRVALPDSSPLAQLPPEAAALEMASLSVDAALPELDEAPVSAVADAKSGSAGGAALDQYIPRPLLSVAPELQSAVLLPWPDLLASKDRYTEVLRLYIDETGLVQRVEPEGPGLPAAFEQAARDAFMHARFAPGQVDGREVKSLIRIEVNFSATRSARSSQ